MKSKILLLMMTIFTLFFVAACFPGEVTLFTDAVYAQIDSQIGLPAETETDLTLKDSLVVLEADFDVTWSSNNTAVITDEGVVTRPSAETGNVSVIMTATLTESDPENEPLETTRTYTVIVIALPGSTFTVTFNSNGGSVVSDLTANQGETIMAPTEPTRAGFIFDGWYQDAAFTTLWNFTTDTVTADTTLFAKWTAIQTFTVTFDPNNGNPTFTQTITQGGFATVPSNPVKPGYTFTNWQTTLGTVWNFTTNAVNADITLTAQYDINLYTINYVIPEGALLTLGTTSFDIHTAVDDLGSATLENHSFLGWFTEATGGEQITNYPVGTVGNKTLYAQFLEDEKFTVTFNDNNGNLNDVELYYGYVTEPDDLVRAGYTFAGWYKDAELTMAYDFEFDIVSEDITLYAKWELVTYTITYDANFGLHETEKTSYTVDTPTFDLDPASKEGYLFLGWFTEAIGGLEISEVTLGSTGNLMLYARFEAITYTITFDADGGMVEPATIQYTVESPTFMLPIPTKVDYAFNGWLSTSLEIVFDEIEQGTMLTDTFVALWVEIIEINFYDYTEANASYYELTYLDGMFTEYVIYEDALYGRGDNGLGQLANGSNMPSEQWINMMPFFDLGIDEYIVHYVLQAPTFLVVTSQNRILVWGFMGFDIDEEPMVELSPVDMTALLDLEGADIEYIAHLFFTILVQTSDGRILSLQDGTINDVTPVLDPLEFIEWVPVFGGGELTDSNVFFTGDRIFIFPIFGGNAFIDMTTHFPLEEGEEILAIFTQGEGIHMITTDFYRFAQLPELEEDPILTIQLPITLPLNEGEMILDTFGGGGIVTSEHRVFLPVYVMLDEMSEFPDEVIFHDVTDDLGLLPGEEILATFNPVFVLTSLNRLLLVMPDESFTTDPLATPVFEVIEIDTTSFDEGEIILYSSFVQGTPVVISSLGAYQVEMSMEGISLEPVQLSVYSLIYTGYYPANALALYEPFDDRPYEAFDMWYEDEALTIPFNPESAFDGMNLYAGWVPTHYQVSFEMGFEEEPIEALYVPFDQIPVEPILLEREHFTLEGWYYYDAFFNYYTYDFTTPLNQDVVLYPMWLNKQYDVELVYDLVEETETVKGSALMPLQYLQFQAPEGYEIAGLYLDEAMTIPLNLEDELIGPMTIYVMLEALTYDVYYYLDTESVTYEDIFTVGSANYGVTSDGRVFAWGFNNNGSLGIGFTSLFDVVTPYEMTSLLGLLPGESIAAIYGDETPSKVLVTSEGRVFMWGYPNGTEDYFSTPQDVTSMLNLSLSDSVIYARLTWSDAYFLTALGVVIYYDFDEMMFNHYVSSTTFNDVLYVSTFGFNPSIIIIEKAAVNVYTLDDLLGEAILDMSYTALLNGGNIVGQAFDFETFSYEFYFTDQGDILKYGEWTDEFLTHGSVTLNPEELITHVFDDFGTQYLLTNQDRLLYKTPTSEGSVDLSDLVVDEKIIGYHQGQFISNYGNGYSVVFEYTLEFSQVYYDIMGPTEIVDLLVIGFDAFGLTNDGNLVRPFMSEAPVLSFLVGTNLVMDQTVFGEVFEYLVPEERVGYVFEGWFTNTDYFFPMFEEPFSDLILYAKWTMIE